MPISWLEKGYSPPCCLAIKPALASHCHAPKHTKYLCVLLMFIGTVEHIFEVIIESVSGLKLLDNMIWGEADCFIQYHFPAQMASAGRVGGATVVCGMLYVLLSQMILHYVTRKGNCAFYKITSVCLNF